MILDNNNLIASKSWSGDIDRGDSLAETGRIYFLTYLLAQYVKIMPTATELLPPFDISLLKLEDAQGNWIRSPQQYPDPKDVSRDQLDPMIMCLSIRRIDHYTHSEYFKMLYRFGLYPNWDFHPFKIGDIASPENWNHYIRHYESVGLLLPLLWFGDLFMLLNAVIISYFTPDQSRNDLNHMISLLHAEALRPTFISRWAARIYLTNHGGTRPLWALRDYYKPGTGNEDLISFYVPAMNWLRERVV